MAWQKINSDPAPVTRWHKWTRTPGCSVEGELLSIRTGRYNVFIVLRQDDNSELAVPIKGYAGDENLSQVIARIAIGSQVKLVYAGKAQGKRGAPRLVWDVYVRAAE